MKYFQKCCVPLLAVTIIAGALRLPRLCLRPMHCDEAVHAIKFGSLLEAGDYKYDPYEYHGPTLNYLTLVPAWLTGSQEISDVTEPALRAVPVFFGILLVLLTILLADGLGPAAAVCAAFLLAVSPAFVFYSRYYIQEIPLVCFTFGLITCGYRYTQSKKITWAVLAGIFLGLAHATKETCIIAFGSMLAAILLTVLVHRREQNIKMEMKLWHAIAGLVAGLAVSALFYSSFFKNPAGILDSFRAYVPYFSRAGQNQLHIHPWYYYLKILLYSKAAPGPFFSEALIVVLAVVGFIAAMSAKALRFVNPGLLRFLGFYTIIMTVVYSLIPYKTPWCLLGLLHGMILLAAVGTVTLIKLSPNVLARVFVVLLLLAALAHLTFQAYIGSYKYYTDHRNPYVYAHPTTDVFDIARRIQDVSGAHPDGRKMYIQVICPDDDYWPLPWYLRNFPNVGWWNKVDESAPAAPLIIAFADLQPQLMKKLYELPPPGRRPLYVPLFEKYTELRPQVELLGLVSAELWDSYQRKANN